jgi:hypothetical protein
MMRAAVFGFLLLLSGAAPLVAQTNEQPPPKDFVFFTAGANCPVSMRALQGSGGGLVAVRGAKPINGPAQRIHLILAGKSQRITRATVMVEGLSPRNRIARTDTGGGLTSDLTRTIDVTFTPGDHNEATADLVLPGFTSITSIELQSISYQDVSTWSVPGPRACRVAPDPFMLVADK